MVDEEGIVEADEVVAEVGDHVDVSGDGESGGEERGGMNERGSNEGVQGVVVEGARTG